MANHFFLKKKEKNVGSWLTAMSGSCPEMWSNIYLENGVVIVISSVRGSPRNVTSYICLEKGVGIKQLWYST